MLPRLTGHLVRYGRTILCYLVLLVAAHRQLSAVDAVENGMTKCECLKKMQEHSAPCRTQVKVSTVEWHSLLHVAFSAFMFKLSRLSLFKRVFSCPLYFPSVSFEICRAKIEPPTK